MTEEKQMSKRKFLFFGLVIIAILAITAILMANYITSSIQFDQKDHYQTGIKETESYKKNQCAELLDYLKTNYHTDSVNINLDYYNYLAHVYNKMKDIGCTPMPQPIDTIQENFK